MVEGSNIMKNTNETKSVRVCPSCLEEVSLDLWSLTEAHCDNCELVTGSEFSCSCGEEYETVDAAIACKKCRAYLHSWDYIVREVRNGMGHVVWRAGA